MLPEAFLNRMQELLKEEYAPFLESYQQTKQQALRLNPLKGDSGRFLEIAPFSLSPVPWAADGYYYGESDRPGRHPFHEAGAYYIQEASAMAPVSYLDPKPGEILLDLCAAPGGKSTQIAAAMQGKGLLICNEINPQRARVLSENIERMGIGNALVVSHTPEELAGRFAGFFDRILVDAPCSGEGMFRKKEEACEEWSLANIRLCAKRQQDILAQAAVMLKTGGRLVYSTCTFAPEENEGSLYAFLKKYPEFSLLEAEKLTGMSSARREWIPEELMPEEPLAGEADKAIRLWPHRIKGEGHFVAVLQKNEERERPARIVRQADLKVGVLPEKNVPEYTAFCRGFLKNPLPGNLLLFGEQLYLLPEEMPALQGLKVLRSGLHLGTRKTKWFEPAHALALSLKPEDCVNSMNLSAEDQRVMAYLNGQMLETDSRSGWCLMAVEGYSLGFGKVVDGRMKNHYPKGLRKNW